jgi:hypothetical protein
MNVRDPELLSKLSELSKLRQPLSGPIAVITDGPREAYCCISKSYIPLLYVHKVYKVYRVYKVGLYVVHTGV